jgi:RNA polymerase-binding protein DksA
MMPDPWTDQFREKLLANKDELQQRLARIEENHRRPLAQDSTERATELEDLDVVDALGNEARFELRQITDALARIETQDYGICEACGEPIREARLLAYPHAAKCIDCATDKAPADALQHAAE